jgi:nonspecific dipeptidase
MYEEIEFDVCEFRGDVGTAKLRHNEKKEDILMSRWRHPSISLHGIEGAFSEPGGKTVIPGKVIGKFSLRIVPNQTVEGVKKCVLAHLDQLWAKRASPNKMKVNLKS